MELLQIITVLVFCIIVCLIIILAEVFPIILKEREKHKNE